MTALAVGAFDGIGAQSNAKPTLASNEWPTYGHDSGGMRFSPLTQLTPANVGSSTSRGSITCGRRRQQLKPPDEAQTFRP